VLVPDRYPFTHTPILGNGAPKVVEGISESRNVSCS
jgi:hypothetical protein